MTQWATEGVVVSGLGRPRTCSCGECAKCKHRIYMKAYYDKNKQQYVNVEKRRARENYRYHNDPEFKQRKRARLLARQRVRRGTIPPPACSVCGGVEGVVLHHEDYSKPYDTIAFCLEHHIEHHNGQMNPRR